MSTELADRIAAHIEAFCSPHPDRHVGGPGNRAATEYFAQVATDLRFSVTCSEFDCVDWEHGDVMLQAGDERFEAHVGPYSRAASVTAPLVAANSIEELEAANLTGAIVLLHGDIARHQLMPKNFIFFNPKSHQRIIRALEIGEPAAVIAATGRNPELVGDLYPFPLIEDADFDIPTSYMRDVDGERLVRYAGEPVTLRFDSRRIPAKAEHVVASMAGDREGRVVVFGHIDSKEGTPGALDNAGGAAVLLALAELLEAGHHGLSVDLVPLNGEDYYAAPGQMKWVHENEGRMDDIVLGMNADAAGWRGRRSHVSMYGVRPETAQAIEELLVAYDTIEVGPPWPMSDHGIFIHYGVPAVAFTSEGCADLLATVCHTERDVPDLADPETLADIARLMHDVIERIT